MSRFCFMILFGFLVTSVDLAFGQDESTTAVPTKPVAEENQEAIDARIDMMKQVMKGMFAQVEMTKEQRSEIDRSIDENVPEVVVASQKFQSILTPAEKRQYKGHFRMGRVAMYTVDRAKDYALRRLKLPRERIQEYYKAEAVLKYAEAKMNNEIASVLTKEQRSKLSMFSRNQTRILAYQIVLPNMKSESDIAAVTKELKKIDTLKVINVRKDDQVVRVEVQYGTKVLSTLRELVKAGNGLFNDFSFEDNADDDFAEISKIQPGREYILEAIKEKNEAKARAAKAEAEAKAARENSSPDQSSDK